MSPNAATEFARWLAQDQPELFVALFRRAQPSVVKSLDDFSDVLSTIGTSIGNAVNSVGSFLSSAQGQQTISALGAAYLQSRAAQQAVNANLSRAQAGLAPAPIETRYNPNSGQYEAVVNSPQAPTGFVPLAQAQNIVPSAFSSVPTWVWAAGGGVAAAILLRAIFR